MAHDAGLDRPADHDVVVWYVEERDHYDVYRITKGTTIIGEFTGRSIGSSLLQVAAEHADGRTIWIKDELGYRRLISPD